MYAKTILGILCVFLFVSPQLIHAGAADLDLTFDSDGKVTTDFTGGNDLGRSVVIQQDGKLIVVGRMFNSTNSDTDFGVARYNTDGSLDMNFGVGGKVSTDFAANDDEAFAVALQTDGKIVVAGSSFSNGGTYDFALVRYNFDGSLDQSFGTGGKVATDFAGDSDEARAVAIQSDGKIVAAGSMFNTSSGSDFAVARYQPDGSLDSSFGFNGKVNTDFFSNDFDEGYAVLMQPDEKIVVVGRRSNGTDLDIAMARYNPDGSLDDSLSNDGLVITDITGQDDGAFGVAYQTDGKLVVVGSTVSGGTYDFLVARYTNDGHLDNTFSFDGIVITDFGAPFDEAIAATIQNDGKIIVAGYSNSGADGDFALARYESDGTPDVTFDNDGKVTSDIGATDVALAVTLQTDGKIVAAGYSLNGGIGDFAVARYEGDPAPQCVFCDDFQDGVLAPDWAYIKPTWSEANGNLIGTPSSRKAEATANPAFGGCIQCTVNATMSTAGGPSNKVWLLAWYQDKKNGVEILMKEENDKWVLKQRSGGKVVTKVNAAATIQPNVFYDVEVSFDGTNFSLKVDGVTLATTTASSSPIGTVGFRVKNTVGSFASISVN
jgi:uncharacterized delta-60 repeat protein